MFLLLSIAAIALYTTQSYALTQDANVSVSMRNHGYTMGDFIHQKVHITLPENQTINSDSLPLTGYINPWLDLNKITFEQKSNEVTLILDWQIFATVEFTQILKTPEVILKTNAKNPLQVRIESQPFYYSSALPQTTVGIQRRPNLPPLLFDTFSPLLGAGIFGLLALLGIFTWAWLQDRFTWLPYAAGPITKLARKLRGQSVVSLDDVPAVYQALNQCAEKNVYLNQQEILYEKAQYLKPYQSYIQQFLTSANHAIYQHKTIGRAHLQTEVHDFGSTKWINEAAKAERVLRRLQRQSK